MRRVYDDYYDTPKLYYTNKDCPKTAQEINAFCKITKDDILLLYTSFFKKIAEAFKMTFNDIEKDFLEYSKSYKVQLGSLATYQYIDNGVKNSEIRVLINNYVFMDDYDYNKFKWVKRNFDLCLVRETKKAREVFDIFILWLVEKYYKDFYNLLTWGCGCDLWSMLYGEITIETTLSTRGAKLLVPISAIVNKDFTKIKETLIMLFRNRKFRCIEQGALEELFHTKQVKRLLEWFAKK